MNITFFLLAYSLSFSSLFTHALALNIWTSVAPPAGFHPTNSSIPLEKCVEDDYLGSFEAQTLSADASAFCSCFISIPLATEFSDITTTMSDHFSHQVSLLAHRSMQNCHYNYEWTNNERRGRHCSSDHSNTYHYNSALSPVSFDEASTCGTNTCGGATSPPAVCSSVCAELWNHLYTKCALECMLLLECSHVNYHC